MRHLFIIFSFFVSLPLFGQEGWVMGIGIAKTQGEANEIAINELSRSIYTSIDSKSTLLLADIDGECHENFERISTINSCKIEEESQMIVEYKKHKYYVTRYINKNRYVLSRLEKYYEYCSKAEDIKGNGEPHEQNFVLGYYYKAYCALTDGLMPYFLDEYKILKESLYTKIKNTYSSKEYSGLFFYREEWYGYRARMFSFDELVGFEFENKDGEWVSADTYFYDDTICNYAFHGNESEKRYCSIRYPKLHKGLNGEKEFHYRLTYEICENGNIEKIIVPDEFYFGVKEFLYI